MKMNVSYTQLTPGNDLPDISGLKPFLAVLVIDDHSAPEWREKISSWLVKSGCRNMMSWGDEREAWDEAVDLANISQFNSGGIPVDELVLAVEHGSHALEQFFKEAKISASQDCADFTNVLLAHISKENKEQELISLYSRA
jgi:hypothetical protein